MKKYKIAYILLIFTTIINLNFCVFADDELDEISITADDIEQFITTDANLMKAPTINSRNAVVYDRISRKSYIWERRKY